MEVPGGAKRVGSDGCDWPGMPSPLLEQLDDGFALGSSGERPHLIFSAVCASQEWNIWPELLVESQGMLDTIPVSIARDACRNQVGLLGHLGFPE